MATILLVEDNEMNRDLIAQYLDYVGYTVVTASDGAEGVERARADAPDLILMDISLPSMDGWEATRRLKAAPETRDIPVIALTAHAMASDRQMSLAAGCNDYESKPIDFTRLLTKIRRFVS